jgi:hypothetical protein
MCLHGVDSDDFAFLFLPVVTNSYDTQKVRFVVTLWYNDNILTGVDPILECCGRQSAGRLFNDAVGISDYVASNDKDSE